MTSIARLAPSLAALLCVAAGDLAAQEVRYGGDPGDAHTYTRTQEDHVVQTVDGNEQRADVQSFWRFTTTVVEEEEASLVVDVVHDSLAIDSTPELPEPPDFSAMYGRPIRVTLSKRGDVMDVTVPEPLAGASGRLDFESAYRSFWPVLPAGEIEPGTTWSDTMRIETSQNGLDLTVTRVNAYTAGENGSYAGRQGRRVDYTAEITLEGGGAQEGNEIALSGTGTGSGTFWIAPDPGLYLGGEEASEMRMDAFVTTAGQNLLIPIVQTRRETIRLVE